MQIEDALSEEELPSANSDSIGNVLEMQHPSTETEVVQSSDATDGISLVGMSQE